MKLPIEKLVAVLGHRDLRYNTGGTHRLAGRVSLGIAATISRCHGLMIAPEADVELTDLSVNGAGLICGNAMDIGDQFILHVVRDDVPVLDVQCLAKRCVQLPTARFKIGAEYVQLLPACPKPAAE